MKSIFAKLFQTRRGSSFGGEPTNLQPSLWSAPARNPNPVPSEKAGAPPTASGINPFAETARRERRRPLFQASPALPRRPFWLRVRDWLGWPAASGARRRLFASSDQLELVLGRPQLPPRKSNLEIGSPARTRRSDAASNSKVIYESKPASAKDAAQMMEESDRAYLRLRGRRLESLKLPND